MRLRSNGQKGLTGTSLNSSAGVQTITGLFAVAPNYATIAGGDWIEITLEPNTANMEVVWLIAYTAGSLNGTILRGAEDATLHPVAAHASGVPWDHGLTIADMTAGQILDHQGTLDFNAVPTTAIDATTAFHVPACDITPACTGEPVRLRMQVYLSHGTTGWIAGRYMVAYIGDTTLSAFPPSVVPGTTVNSHGQVTGAAGELQPYVVDRVIYPQAGTRTYGIFAYLSNSGLTAALVYGDPNHETFLEARIDG